VATHNRAARLRRLLDSLAAQTVGTARFELLVIDDGSTDETPQVLTEHEARGDLALRVLRHQTPRGPAAARDIGWRSSEAGVIVFTDDDCVATPGWLEALLAASETHPGDVIMGRTLPDPTEAHLQSPFTRTIHIESAGPPYETCNILYPRGVLERVDGFDTTLPDRGGEDTDLGWRASEAGVDFVYAGDALAYHAVLHPGPIGMLRAALRWERSVPMFKRHPGLRRAHLHRGVFFSPTHEHLVLFLLALVLPRRLWPVSLLLAAPYLRRLVWRRSGPLLAPYILVHDALELGSVTRGALRERVLML
jgi:glycosyltransferase involved in cell wall biosynthesis